MYGLAFLFYMLTLMRMVLSKIELESNYGISLLDLELNDRVFCWCAFSYKVLMLVMIEVNQFVSFL